MTVTLYNCHQGLWHRTVLEGVWARWSQGFSYTGGGMEGGNAESLLLIPWREGYMAPEEFQALSDPADCFTFQAGDGVYPGVGPELDSGHLRSQLPGVQILSEVRTHRPGSPLDHWEVLAR